MATIYRFQVLQPVGRRPWVGAPPGALPKHARAYGALTASLNSRVSGPQRGPAARVLQRIPPAIPAFQIRLPPLVARPILPQRVQRPTLTAVPPATNLVVTVRPPQAVIAPVVRSLTGAPRAFVLRPGTGRPARMPEVLPVLSIRAVLAVPGPRPRVLSVLRTVTRVPRFIYGPQFLIRDPGLLVQLGDPGLNFTIADPGLTVALPLE